MRAGGARAQVMIVLGWLEYFLELMFLDAGVWPGCKQWNAVSVAGLACELMPPRTL